MLTGKINDLKSRVIQFASLIEQMTDKSIRGLVSRNIDILDEVINSDEPGANKFELEIDGICINLVAKFQPVAKDLRTIFMIYNMNSALERMGDHGVNIAECSLELVQYPVVKPLIDIPRMQETVKKMLRNSITSFINEDPVLAGDVCRADSIIDELRDQIIRELVTFMAANTAIIGQSIKLMKIAENLERIADLTTNICEDVIFMAEGKVVKHGWE